MSKQNWLLVGVGLATFLSSLLFLRKRASAKAASTQGAYHPNLKTLDPEMREDLESGSAM